MEGMIYPCHRIVYARMSAVRRPHILKIATFSDKDNAKTLPYVCQLLGTAKVSIFATRTSTH